MKDGSMFGSLKKDVGWRPFLCLIENYITNTLFEGYDVEVFQYNTTTTDFYYIWNGFWKNDAVIYIVLKGNQEKSTVQNGYGNLTLMMKS